MLKIRMQRVGRKNRPSFRLVLVEHSSAAKKKAKEILGWRDPLKKTQEINAERVKYWISKGVQLSDTVHNFLIANKIIEGNKITVHKKSKKTPEAQIANTPAVDAQASSNEISQVTEPEAKAETADPVEKPAEVQA